MDRQEFKKEIEVRGWSIERLAERWGCSKTRIHQIAVEIENGHGKRLFHIDALRGLPYLSVKPNDKIK